MIVGQTLAHQEFGVALEIAAAGGLRPFALDSSAGQPSLAGAAGTRGALVGKLETPPEAGVEDLLLGVALEVA